MREKAEKSRQAVTILGDQESATNRVHKKKKFSTGFFHSKTISGIA